MRTGTGIAGATLLYGPQAGEPDLVLTMQLLLDEMRGDGRRIGGVKLTATTLRVRADPFDLVLTLASAPLPLAATRGLLRPHRDDETPDFARVHLARMLRLHRHAMGFLLRRRGAPSADADESARSLAREGRLSLLPVIEAAPPALLIWQPGGLVLTTDEFRAANPALLLAPGDAGGPLHLPPVERLGLLRPGAQGATDPPPVPTRLGLAASRSAGRAFGGDPATDPHRVPLPGIERASDRVTQALRQRPTNAAGTPRQAAAKAFWATLLPALGGFGGMS